MQGELPISDSPVEVAINRPFIFERQCTFIVRGFSRYVTKWQLRQFVNAFVVNGMVGSIKKYKGNIFNKYDRIFPNLIFHCILSVGFMGCTKNLAKRGGSRHKSISFKSFINNT